MSLRDRVLSTPSRKQKTVTIPEWGEDVIVRELDGDARLKFLASINPNDPRVDLAPLVPFLHELVIDEQGKAVFEAADVDTLKSDHPGPVTTIILAAIDLSEIGEADAEAAEGNSVANPG